MKNNTYEEQLKNEADLLVSQLKHLGVQNKSVVGDWEVTNYEASETNADSNIEADQMEDLGERQAILSDLEVRLKNINLALKKISEDRFGLCEICQSHIEEARLLANPAARTCVSHINNEADLAL